MSDEANFVLRARRGLACRRSRPTALPFALWLQPYARAAGAVAALSTAAEGPWCGLRDASWLAGPGKTIFAHLADMGVESTVLPPGRLRRGNRARLKLFDSGT